MVGTSVTKESKQRSTNSFDSLVCVSRQKIIKIDIRQKVNKFNSEKDPQKDGLSLLIE